MSINNRNLNSHQYRFYSREGFIGKAPCRNSIKKLIPEQVMARAHVCCSESWKVCVLVDGQDQVLDRITYGKAWTHMCKNIYNKITITPGKLPQVKGAQPSAYAY
jgi:hypothetical protein